MTIKSNEKKIMLIGRIAPKKNLFDGQTVKTRSMYRLLCEIYGQENILVVDTDEWAHRAPVIMFDLMRCLHQCNDIVILLSKRGRKALFPLLSLLAKRNRARVYQNLIGGWLANNLGEYPQWVDYLNSFEVNWVESHRLVDNLTERGVTNARYLPNFKYLRAAEITEEYAHDNSWCFCTFSRVMELKGVGDAIKIIEKLNRSQDGRKYSLDIYGPIDDNYKEELESLLACSPHSHYCGVVPPNQSVDTIFDYDALLFPTKWKPEGIPGTIIDAFFAGTPIIGARWQYYNEMLDDGITGFSYEFGENEFLEDAILRFVSLEDSERNEMRQSCIERSRLYGPDAVAYEIKRVINQ